MTLRNAILRDCPQQYSEYIGKHCKVVFDDQLVIEFFSEGLKTSSIVEHSQKGYVHTFKTKSGSIYKIESED